MRNDYRNYLFESYLEVVKVYKPKIIVFENVEGMLSAMPDGESIIDKIRKGFNEYGFDIIDDIREEALLDLTKFGVPQKKRVILVGLNRKYFGNKGENQKHCNIFYNVILNNYRTETIPNVSDAIADLPKLYPSQEDYRVGSRKYSHLPNITEINWHIPRYHNRRDIDIFKILAHDIATGENKYQNIEALKNFTQKNW